MLQGKRVVLVLILLSLTLVLGAENIEGIDPAPEGKAVVYFFRPTVFGAARPFHIFDGENYLIRLMGANYFRYECEPGEHVFWAAAENKSFLRAELEAGHVYAVLARIIPGAFSGRVVLEPLTTESKYWKKCVKQANKKKPRQEDAKYREEWESKHPDYVEKALKAWKEGGEKTNHVLAADGYIR
jgi:hypothetical protein